ncbi:hypothetical protein HYT26_01060 [Candidatus Pacearchaeota archaeon]|nr:hypothetical protein [Candidatus Pacearchaeota archaeon]
MEPEEMYKKLEKLRESKAGIQTKKPLQSGNSINLNYHAIINSMPCSIPLSDLVKYHNYRHEMDKKKA